MILVLKFFYCLRPWCCEGYAMPAGVIASNVRNNRKKQNQQQGVKFVDGGESTALNEINSLHGSEAFINRRRVGMKINFDAFLNFCKHLKGFACMVL